MTKNVWYLYQGMRIFLKFAHWIRYAGFNWQLWRYNE